MTDIISEQTEATAGGIDALTGLLSMPTIKNGGFAHPGDKLVGVVAYDVTDDDVTPALEFGTSEVKRDRNGRTQYKMCVTLDVEDWTDTDLVGSRARIYAEGSKLRAIVQAVAKAGHRAPKAGARVELVFTESKKSGGGFPAKLFSATYTPDAGPATVSDATENRKAENDTRATANEAPVQVPAPAAPTNFDPSQLDPEQYAQYLKLTGQA